MAEDTPSDAGAPSVAPTVASVLGIKGHLRFRAHGSSQKAHVVLRRVELDDSEDEGEGKPAFYFSLFAQKRIEVKPGKEILLTVADGPFKDQAIMFEGDIPGVASGSDEEETQVADDEENFAAQEQSMPPKMRKPWVKRTEELVIAASPILVPPTHHSVGVQAQAEFASFSTQTTFDVEGEIRAREPLQTDLDDNMTDKSTPMELSPIQSVQELAPVETIASTLTIRSAEMEQQSERDRSLSPMELDSPPSSPPQSPVRTPADLPAVRSQMKPDASPAENAKSPIQINGFSTLPPPIVAEPPFVPSSPIHPIRGLSNEVARELSSIDIPGFGRSMMDVSLAGAPAQSPPRAMPEARKSHSPPLPKASDLTLGPSKPPPEAIQAPIASRPDEATTPARRSTYPIVPSGRLPPASVTAAPKPVRRKIPNPFVSGGFMTDFVGLSSASTSKPSTPLADGSPGPAFTSATGTSATPVDHASSAPTSPIAPTADMASAPISSTLSHVPSVPPPVPPTVAPISAHPAPALVPATVPTASVSTTVPDFTSPAFTESLRSALSALVSAQATPVQETASSPTPEVSAPQIQSDVKREPSPLTISPSIRRAATPPDEIPGLSGMFDNFPKPRARPPPAERSPAPLPRVPEPSPIARPINPPMSVRAQAAPVAEPPTPSTPTVQQSRPAPPPFMPARQFTPSEQPPSMWGGPSRRTSITSIRSASLADAGRPSSASPRMPVAPFVPPSYAASLTPPSLPPPPISFPPFPPTGAPALPLPNLPPPHYLPPSMPPPRIPPPKMFPPPPPPPNLSSANATAPALPTPRVPPPPPPPPPPPNLSAANAISPSFSRYPNRPTPSFMPPSFPPPSATPSSQPLSAPPPMFPPPPSAVPSMPPRSIPPPLFPPPPAAPSAPPAPPPSMPPYAPDFATYDPSQPFIPGLQGKSTYNVSTTPTPSSPSRELRGGEPVWPSPPGLREALANLRMQMASPQQRQRQRQQELEQEAYRQQEQGSYRRQEQEQEQESYRQQESYQQQDLYQPREQEPYQQRRQQEQQEESYQVRQQDGYQFRQQEIRQFRQKEKHQYQQQEQYHQQEQEQERYVLQEQEPYQQQQESYQQHQRYVAPAVPPSQAMPPRALLSRPTSRYSPPTPPPVPYRPSIDTASIAAPQPVPSGITNALKRKVSPPVSASTLVGFQPSFDSHRSFQWPALTSNISAQIKGEDVGIRGIVFSATGNYIAVNCHDCTVRVWDNILHTEIARLSHVAPVVSAAWLEDDEGILSLSENGSLGKWTRTPQMPGDQWQWTKIAEPSNAERKPEDVPTAMAYIRDRIAVAFPRVGVKVWMLNKETWQPQRSILRQNVTAIHFVEDGDALLGGTKDGVLWYCQIPNGTLRAYTFFKSTVYHIDVNHSGSHALVAQTGGRTHIVGIRQDDNKGKIEQVYALKDSDSHPNATYDFGALFTSKDSLIMFGTVDGCVLLWDKDKAVISCGLDLGEGAVAQAVGSFTSRSSSSENCLVTGSKDGKLTWWPQPSISDIEEFSHKRMKTGAS